MSIPTRRLESQNRLDTSCPASYGLAQLIGVSLQEPGGQGWRLWIAYEHRGPLGTNGPQRAYVFLEMPLVSEEAYKFVTSPYRVT